MCKYILAGRSAVDREFLYIEGSGRAADVAVRAAWYFFATHYGRAMLNSLRNLRFW